MHIMVTNDDGATAPGILALAQAMRHLGKVSILAPDHNWSATGHVRTLDRPLRVKTVILADGSEAFACDGAPSDCVALAICGFFEEKPDLIVSGINPNANVGHDVTYSGTVTAAMEAAISGLPAAAFSLDSTKSQHNMEDFCTAAEYALRIARAIEQYHLAPNTLLNVNVPDIPKDQIKGIQITRQGLRVYHDKLDKRIDPRGNPYYWAIGEMPTSIPERGTEIGALAEGFVSVTPIQLDMTAYHLVPELNFWQWDSLPQ